MSSSISSSKRRFILKAVLSFLCMLAAYSLLAPVFFPKGGTPQSAWQENIIRAEKYIYGEGEPSFVIVGTSVSMRFKDLLPEDFYSLSINGANLFNGLDIIQKSGKYPKKAVLIETNFLMRVGEEKLLGDLFSPVHRLNVIFPALRSEYSPVSVVIGLTEASQKEEAQKNVTDHNSEMFNIWLKAQKTDYSQTPDPNELDRKTERLYRIVRELMDRKTEVVFFEIPMHPKISDSPKQNMIRRKLLERFPPGEYKWISLPDPKGYRTTDVIHLDDEGAKRYSEYLQGELKKAL